MIKTCIDHLPESKQRDIALIRNTILNCTDIVVKRSTVTKTDFKVVHIILFGSHASDTGTSNAANDHTGDYNILVVVNEPAMEADHILWRWIDEKVGRRVKCPVNIHVHTAAYVDVCLQEGNQFFNDIRRVGIYLFSHNISSTGLPAPKNLTGEEKKQIAETHFKHWFERAKGWYAIFTTASDKGFLKEAAFLLHQTTECYFIAYLMVVCSYRPKTHNIKQLRSMAIQQDPRMANVFPQKTPFARRSFTRLNRAFIDSLYSEHYSIDGDELNGLAEQVERLKQEVERGCEGYIQSLVEPHGN